jgi:uncharacterized membrane protein YhiD involved in acid resistance
MPGAFNRDPSPDERERLLRGPAAGIAIWLLAGMGTLSLTIALAAFSFAWNASERLARLEERDVGRSQATEQLRAYVTERFDRLERRLDIIQKPHGDGFNN